MSQFALTPAAEGELPNIPEYLAGDTRSAR
jgi:hypothetical protein